MEQQQNYEESQVGILKRYYSRRKLLASLEKKKVGAKPSFEELRVVYEALSKDLNRRYPECTSKTEAERRLFHAIEQATKLKFHRSIWIGNRNFDLFCPAVGNLHQPIVKGNKIHRTHPIMRGLVIESDGSIHDREFKMRKDESKSSFLHDLGIGLSVIRNGDLHKTSVNDLIDRLRNLPRLDSRARERLRRKIYLSTIAYHADNVTIARLYKVTVNEVQE